MPPRIWEDIEAQEYKRSMIVWAVGKIGIVKYVWACVYARSKKGKEEMKFRSDVNE